MKRLLCLALQGLVAIAAQAAPGTATLQDLTMNPGGRYEFELNSATATPGNGADFLNIVNTLNITAGTTPNSVFTVSIISLNNANASAPLSNFDPTRAYSYTIATAGAVITGYNAAKFTIDSSQFLNNLQGGRFDILLSSDGHSLILRFRPGTIRPLQITEIALDRTSHARLGARQSYLGCNHRAVVSDPKTSRSRSGGWIDDSPTYEAIATSPMATSFYTSAAPNSEFWRVIEVP